MTTTPPATTLYTALLAAQKAMGPVKKDASNPAFRSKYASLQSVLDTVEEPLSDNGLVLLQRLDGLDGHTIPLLITEIVHAATGDKVESRVAVVCKDPNDPQKFGGALTYYRRYSLLALLGLAPEDDDGNAASKPAPPRNQRQRDEDVPVAGGFLVAPDGTPKSAPRPTPAPPAASTGTMRVVDNPVALDAKPAPVGWNEVWKFAKAMDIPDRPALDKALAPEKTTEMAEWQILARLKEIKAERIKQPASFAG